MDAVQEHEEIIDKLSTTATETGTDLARETKRTHTTKKQLIVHTSRGQSRSSLTVKIRVAQVSLNLLSYVEKLDPMYMVFSI